MPRRSVQRIKKRDQLVSAVDHLLSLTAPLPQNPQIPPALANLFADEAWNRHLQLRKITDEISELESSPGSSGCEKTPSDLRLPAVAKFQQWLVSNGVDVSGIEVVEFPGYGLGLKATKCFTEGENIINIPRKLIMTEDCAKKSILGSFINKDPILTLMPNISLVMYLLLEKFTPNSFWKPYIDILPKSYDTVLYFSLENLKELKGTPNFKPALKLCQDIARQYAYFFKQLQNSSEPVANILKNVFTYKEYCWAVSTVMTRLNMVPSELNKDSSTTALIPLWDMCNHTNGQITTQFNTENDRAECFALKDYKDGDQILIFYGVRTNAFFFLHNGFVYLENNHDALTINLDISPNDPHQQLKRDLLQKLEINSNTNFQIVDQKVPISTELVAFARVFVMDKENLNLFLDGNYEELLKLDGSTVCPEIEKKAFNFILFRCKLLSHTYESQLSDKISELEISKTDDPISKYEKSEDHTLLVKRLKESELKLLRKAIEFAQTKL